MVYAVRMTGMTLLLCAALTTVAARWINRYDQPVSFVCPSGQFLSDINSVHHNRHEDRIWSLGCRHVPVQGKFSSSHFTGYVNDWDQTFAYQCPGEGFITGIASVHHNRHEDRRYRFLCGTVAGAVAHNCYFTGWQNHMDRPLDYHVPEGKVLKGVTSYHSNHREDRRFNFLVCDFSSSKVFSKEH